jgi:hypothetical protein
MELDDTYEYLYSTHALKAFVDITVEVWKDTDNGGDTL